jgi:hypothetical protein
VVQQPTGNTFTISSGTNAGKTTFMAGETISVRVLLTPRVATPFGAHVHFSGTQEVGTVQPAEGTITFVDFPTGPPGATGPAGPTGLTGAVGPAGPTGATGAIGPTGPAGQSVIGSSEPTGANCTYGGIKYVSATGTAYVCNGAPGAAGATGATGPPGPTGSAGQSVIGSSEPTGANCTYGGIKYVSASGTAYVCNGAAGAQGLPGAQGPAGPQGSTGVPGPAGPQGPAGPAGATGPIGPAGLAGPTGKATGGCNTGPRDTQPAALLLLAFAALRARRRVRRARWRAIQRWCSPPRGDASRILRQSDKVVLGAPIANGPVRAAARGNADARSARARWRPQCLRLPRQPEDRRVPLPPPARVRVRMRTSRVRQQGASFEW